MIDEKVRKVLMCRSTRDKVAIPCSCKLAPPWAYPVISQMVRDGLLVWLDRAHVTEYGVLCEIYLLTPKGIKLCEQEGIEQH